jgi:hypothetical protein
MADIPPPCPPQKPELRKARWALLGAMVGVTMCALLLLLPASIADGVPPNAGVFVLFSNLLILLGGPVFAVVLGMIPKTRAFALGLLLALGVCWLVELALCGGSAAFGLT